MARTSHKREDNDQDVDRINILSSDSPEDSQDIVGGKRKRRCRKGKKNLDQPPVSRHGASNVQAQLVTYPTSIAQSQSMQPGSSAWSQPALPPSMTTTYNNYLVHYPYYKSIPPYKLAYASYYMAYPVYMAYAQPLSQEPSSDPNTTGALPSTLAPAVQPYNPANSTHMEGPTPQSTQLHLPLLPYYQMLQPSPEATQQRSNSVAIQNQVVNVPRSREDDEIGRSDRHGSKRKRGRLSKNTGPK